MASRRSVVVRVTGNLSQGAPNVLFELEDDKNGWLPLPTDSFTSTGNTFQATAQISDLLSLDTFDKAVKQNQDDRKASTDKILAAQSQPMVSPVEAAPISDQMAITGGTFTNEHGALVEVTAAGRPTREQLEAPPPITEATQEVNPPIAASDQNTTPPVTVEPTPETVSDVPADGGAPVVNEPVPAPEADQVKADGNQGV